jgi:hypothetical protein
MKHHHSALIANSRGPTTSASKRVGRCGIGSLLTHTPVHGSWLNQAELEIGLFSKQCLGKRRLGDIRILRAEARAWNRRTNRNRITINWTFDRNKARRKSK